MDEAVDEVVGFFEDIAEGATEVVNDGLEAILNATIYKLCYYIGNGLCKIVGWLDQMFRVFAGINKVTYDGEQDYLINIFFNNSVISNIYWGMALIGIVLCLGFGIAAVVRKTFDLSGRQQQSLGQIITSLLRSIFLILGMSAIMIMVLNATNVLMQQVNYLFSDAANIDTPQTIQYTNEEYAAMARCLNTIGNYGVNPSYSSRYNLNTCFNEIRADLGYLQRQGVFRYHYPTEDADGRRIHTWQSVLQQVANAADLRYDLSVDAANEPVRVALLDAMDAMRNDSSMAPLKSFTRTVPTETLVPLDRTVFLMGTLNAAQNEEYNKDPSLDDAVRGPYYTGEKNIYDLDTFSGDFNLGFAAMNYIMIYVAAVAAIVDLVIIILNCVARIFNMLFLYLISPPVIALQPLDNGGKTRQWMTAFVVQSFSVFATVISMRLLLIYLPIVVSPKLVLFADNTILNQVSKLVLIFGGFEAARKSTGLLTGILADSAGWQAVQAGDMSGMARGFTGRVTGAAAAVGGTVARGAGKAVGFAAKPVTNLAKRPFVAAGRAWSSLGSGDEQRKISESARQNLAVEKETNRLRRQEAAKTAQRSGGSGSRSDDSLPKAGGASKNSDRKNPALPDGRGAPSASPPPLPPKFESSHGGTAAMDHSAGRPESDAAGRQASSGGSAGGTDLSRRPAMNQPAAQQGHDSTAIPLRQSAPQQRNGASAAQPRQPAPRQSGGISSSASVSGSAKTVDGGSARPSIGAPDNLPDRASREESDPTARPTLDGRGSGPQDAPSNPPTGEARSDDLPGRAARETAQATASRQSGGASATQPRQSAPRQSGGISTSVSVSGSAKTVDGGSARPNIGAPDDLPGRATREEPNPTARPTIDGGSGQQNSPSTPPTAAAQSDNLPGRAARESTQATASRQSGGASAASPRQSAPRQSGGISSSASVSGSAKTVDGGSARPNIGAPDDLPDRATREAPSPTVRPTIDGGSGGRSARSNAPTGTAQSNDLPGRATRETAQASASRQGGGASAASPRQSAPRQSGGISSSASVSGSAKTVDGGSARPNIGAPDNLPGRASREEPNPTARPTVDGGSGGRSGPSNAPAGTAQSNDLPGRATRETAQASASRQGGGASAASPRQSAPRQSGGISTSVFVSGSAKTVDGGSARPNIGAPDDLPSRASREAPNPTARPTVDGGSGGRSGPSTPPTGTAQSNDLPGRATRETAQASASRQGGGASAASPRQSAPRQSGGISTSVFVSGSAKTVDGGSARPNIGAPDDLPSRASREEPNPTARPTVDGGSGGRSGPQDAPSNAPTGTAQSNDLPGRARRETTQGTSPQQSGGASPVSVSGGARTVDGGSARPNIGTPDDLPGRASREAPSPTARPTVDGGSGGRSGPSNPPTGTAQMDNLPGRATRETAQGTPPQQSGGASPVSVSGSAKTVDGGSARPNIGAPDDLPGRASREAPNPTARPTVDGGNGGRSGPSNPPTGTAQMDDLPGRATRETAQASDSRQSGSVVVPPPRPSAPQQSDDERPQ